MVKRKFPVLISALALSLFFGACDKPVKPPDEAVPTGFTDLSLTVGTVTLDTVKIGAEVFYKQRAYRCTVNVGASWTPATGEPILFNIYKLYTHSNCTTLVARIFGGGQGLTPGQSIIYIGAVRDTLTYKAVSESLVVSGSEDESPFYFVVRAVSSLQPAGSNAFTKGYEGLGVRLNQLLGGSYQRKLSINNNAMYTANNRVTVSATFNRRDIDTLDYVRFSALLPLFTPADVFSIDSILRSVTPSDSLTIPLNDSFLIRLSDSSIIDTTSRKVTDIFGNRCRPGVVGKFGGHFRVATDPNSLRAFFNDTVMSISTNRTDGDTQWVTAVRHETLPFGPGAKWIYINHPSWNSPLAKGINIQPYNIDITLDVARAGKNARYHSLEDKFCLTSDDIPFFINTFGDTTFEGAVYVWIATRNLSDQFMDNILGTFPSPAVEPNANSFGANFSWADAILETPPERFQLDANGKVSQTLNASGDPSYYETDYRVSPLFHLFLLRADGNVSYDYQGNYAQYIDRKNSSYIGQLMAKGSVLGYNENRLNDFKSQDSITNLISGRPFRLPFTGWFTVQPLAGVSADSTYSWPNLVSYFGPKFGVSGFDELHPSLSSKIGGRTYFSIYSAYCYTPSIQSGVFSPNGCKLYRNPMRSLPYFINSNMSGSKEFVICVFGRGKYFREPRAAISSFTSKTRKYVWDKVPPHFAWNAQIDPTGSAYAPMYYFNPNDGSKTFSDLSITNRGLPNVFDVWFSSKSNLENKDCSLRDVGFGKITSVQLSFNYSADFRGADPVTGFRQYNKPSIKIDIEGSYLGAQHYGAYPVASQWNYQSYSIGNAAFKSIDARLWQGGLWDMWVETEDDLGNKGVAPFLNTDSKYDMTNGFLSVRQISIR